jgi:hypothetical protein
VANAGDDFVRSELRPCSERHGSNPRVSADYIARRGVNPIG